MRAGALDERSFGAVSRDRCGGDGPIEPMPWSRLSTLAEAAQVVTMAGHSAGGIVLDTWHFHRVGGSSETSYWYQLRWCGSFRSAMPVRRGAICSKTR
jgi:hypothetical protein